MLKNLISRGVRLTKPLSKQPIVNGALNVFPINYKNYSSLAHTTQNSTENPISNAPIQFSEETKTLVNKLRDQKRYFAVVQIKGKKYTITENDTIVLNNCPELQLGDKLVLDRVSELGSKDFSIVGKPFVSNQFYDIQATVVEHSQGPEFTVVKFKKRKGYRREHQYRNHYTLLKVHRLEVNKLV